MPPPLNRGALAPPLMRGALMPPPLNRGALMLLARGALNPPLKPRPVNWLLLLVERVPVWALLIGIERVCVVADRGATADPLLRKAPPNAPEWPEAGPVDRVDVVTPADGARV